MESFSARDVRRGGGIVKARSRLLIIARRERFEFPGLSQARATATSPSPTSSRSPARAAARRVHFNAPFERPGPFNTS